MFYPWTWTIGWCTPVVWWDLGGGGQWGEKGGNICITLNNKYLKEKKIKSISISLGEHLKKRKIIFLTTCEYGIICVTKKDWAIFLGEDYRLNLNT